MVSTLMLLIGLFLLYCYTVDKELKKLTASITHVLNGNKGISFDDAIEGEIGVLKAQIVKITLINLMEERSKLSRDKVFLSNMLSDISHQLKTPITSISIMTDLLSQETMTEADKRTFLQNIRKSLNRIEWLVQTLLKAAKLDAGTIEMQQEKTTLKGLVERSIESLDKQHFKVEVSSEINKGTTFIIKFYCDKNLRRKVTE